ncbi:hypothetical protein BT96DRAFT_554781 [Gymnopus androsaceus JB14]|uniref:Uncharacterized protein n=1 Tax=Gymnopus androsaceus JB14 TaxID=1447944 RepID=A0A6A4HZP6_9AGAR|nr:hypothetical protein BT96DRAFT_554781 [Gymnopus androsaceus JB14]
METTPSPANCLHPWPYVPFSYKPYILQSPVPLHLLPQTLIVHDPWGLVHGKLVDGDHDSFDWTDIPDVTYTYKLRLSKEGQERITESRQAAETAARASSSPHVLLTIAPKSESASDSDSSIAAPVFVTVPPPSPPPSHTPEAHLYISPAQTWGEGHHSIAYEAEWEVPRSILSVSKDSQSQGARICRECVAEAAKKILAEKEARRQSALDAYLASKRVPAGDSDSDDDVIIVGPLRGKVEYVENVTLAAAIDVSRCTTVLDRTPVPSSSSTTLPPKTAPHTVQSEMKEEIGLYRGPVTTIHVDSVPWLLPGQRASICPHSGSRLPGPPTASVRVLAKLSRTGGRHLSQEASIYERLPESMSEHWTGFNVVPPLENPTPLGAIIPNYYGYYVRVREDGSFEDENDCVQAQDKDEDAMDVDDPEAKQVPHEEFFSSILLTENCGGRIDLFQEELDASRDERKECAALLLRLHHFGWVLGACHVGKFLIQFGDHADWPIFKSRNDRRYRISGLSRAWSREDALADGRLEEWETLRQEEVQLCTKMLNLEVPASPGRKDER